MSSRLLESVVAPEMARRVEVSVAPACLPWDDDKAPTMSSAEEAAEASASRARMAAQEWGFGDDELARHPSAYRDGLFEGRTALISGGGSGIGRATAFLLTRLGANVMICGRTESRLAETAESIEQRLHRSIPYRAMTIRSPEQVSAVVDEAFVRMGHLDILVNNAGGQFAQAAIDFSVKGWNAVVDTNLNGTWYMMQAAAREWRARDAPGSIVNVVSTVDRGLPQLAHSCAARAGVIHLSMTVAVEWAPLAIRVNCLAAGMIASAGLENYPPEMLQRLGKGNPMRRTGDVWEVAEGIAFLAGSTGKFITGEVLRVNGGSHLWGSSWPLGVPEHFKID